MDQALDVAEDVLWDVDQQLLPVAGADAARAKIARTVLAALEKLDPKVSSDQSLELEWKRTVAHLRLAGLLENSSESVRAEAAYSQARARAEAFLEIDPESGSGLQALADALAGLGRLALYQGNLEASKRYFQHQLEVAERLTKDAATPVENAHRLIDPIRQLANIQQREGDREGAYATYLRAELLSEPQNLGFRERLFSEAGELGDATYRHGDLNAALPMFEHRVLIGLALHQQDPQVEGPLRRLVSARQVYAERLMEAQRIEAADKQYRSIVRDVETLARRNKLDDESREVAESALQILAAWSKARSPEHVAKVAEVQKILSAHRSQSPK